MGFHKVCTPMEWAPDQKLEHYPHPRTTHCHLPATKPGVRVMDKFQSGNLSLIQYCKLCIELFPV